MTRLQKIIYNIISKMTKKDFSHEKDGRMFVVAEPEDFYARAAAKGFDVFSMACLQEYEQINTGRWVKTNVLAFKNHTDMRLYGITTM